MADGLETPQDAHARSLTLLGKLWNDPNIGSAVRQAAKNEFADIVLPEEQFAPILAPLQAQLAETVAMNKVLTERLDADAKEREDRKQAKFQSDFDAKLTSVRTEYNLTDEAFKMVVDRMQETKAYDPEAAAAYIVNKLPKPKVNPNASYRTPKAETFGANTYDERYALLYTNPEEFFNSEIDAAIADPEGYVREAFAA